MLQQFASLAFASPDPFALPSRYETLTDKVVPRSTQTIFQDADHALVTVSLFQKVVDEFKHKVSIKNIAERGRFYQLRQFIYLYSNSCYMYLLLQSKRKLVLGTQAVLYNFKRVFTPMVLISCTF